MMTLDQVLDRLLHHRSYLEAFLAGRVSEQEMSAEDLRALQTIDPVQLRKTAERVRAEVFRRKHRGSGGLVDLFPCTIAAWKTAHPEDVELNEFAARFLESPSFAAYRETSLAGVGTCVEEAFFRFCENQHLGDSATLEAEFLTAMMKALLVSPRPDFLLPAEIRSISQGFFGVSKHGVPTLYAALRGNLVLGPITPFIADLLLSSEGPHAVARRHCVSMEVLQATRTHLAGLGFTHVGEG